MRNPELSESKVAVVLTEQDLEQVGGGLAPLVLWGAWTVGGAALGLAGAAVVHYFGNGSHAH